MITMECQPGGHGGHLGHSMMMDPSSGVIHQQEQEHKKKRELLTLSYLNLMTQFYIQHIRVPNQ